MISALQELVLPLIVFALMTGVLNLRHTTTGYGCRFRCVAWDSPCPAITLIYF